ncbi:nitroreductase family protein [Ktedonobacter racemifer]|uniref:nitroreductase family protein n=1 Tax=Ktedonobacter racemifer TaxID=363277 RepID=UPI00030D1DBD|nr:nitroreductase family protein [Ktedonobacter racemifer]
MTTTTHYKPADNLHPIHDLIRHRWSPRAFSSRPVEQEKLDSLFEAARWAASANNMQPWHFIYATNEQPEEHARLTSILFERNAMWAQKAPVLVLVVAKLYEAPGREMVSFYDVGMAAGALVTQAVDLGLATHQMGGFDASKAREELNIPEGYVPLTMITIGYPGHADDLSDDFRERELAPRVRKEQKDFVFQGRWNG